MNSLYDRIKNRSKEDVKFFIMEALAILEMSDSRNIDFGFINYNNLFFYRGFIPFGSRISFSNLSSKTYLLNDTSYFYDFAEFVSDLSISNDFIFVDCIYNYVNEYFGSPSSIEDKRDEYLDSIAFQTSSNDEDYYEKLDNIDLSDFRNKGIAKSSEKTVMAENLMSLFGIDSYCCFGVMSHGINSSSYAFNIVVIDGIYYLVDFATPVCVKSDNKVVDYKPFMGELNEDELEKLLTDCSVITFDDYEYVDGFKSMNGNYRRYSVGTFNKNKQIGI